MDPGRTTAFAALPGDEIVAVDVNTGDVRWRVADAGRPLVATDAGLLVVRRRHRRLDLALLDPSDGSVASDLGALPAPRWAADQWEHSDGFAATARAHDRTPQVAWRAARRYRGGAAPPPELHDGDDEATGVVEVDLDSGRMRLRPDVDPTSVEAAEAAEPSARAGQGEEPAYRLASRQASDGTTELRLTATGPRDDQPLWETVLHKRADRRPPPLRP